MNAKTIRNLTDLKLLGINTLPDPHLPYRVLLESPTDGAPKEFSNLTGERYIATAI